MPKNGVVRNLVYAQLSFFICLTGTVFITKAGFVYNHGLSFYGSHLKTVLPFGLGFVLCDIFLLRAASIMSDSKSMVKNLVPYLRILAVLLMLIILTPDSLNPLFGFMHTIASSVLFLFEISLAIWLTLRWHSDKFTWVLLVAQFLAGIVAMLSELQLSRYLSESTVFFQLFFGMLLVWTFSNLINQTSGEDKKTVSKAVISEL
jgi:predicted membrane channel-forming protein YqfA (hemolysin III family)